LWTFLKCARLFREYFSPLFFFQIEVLNPLSLWLVFPEERGFGGWVLGSLVGGGFLGLGPVGRGVWGGGFCFGWGWGVGVGGGFFWGFFVGWGWVFWGGLLRVFLELIFCGASGFCLLGTEVLGFFPRRTGDFELSYTVQIAAP